MADKKISALTAKGSNLDETDLFIISKSDGAGGYDTKSITGAELKSFSVNTQTDTYSFVLTDANKLVELNNASAKTFSLPLSGTADFPIGTEIKVAQLGAGQLRIAALAGTGGQTINTCCGSKIASQYGVATLIKRAANDWYLYGDLTT